MSGEYSKPERAVAAFVFGFVLMIPLWTWANIERPLARAKAQAELDARTGLDHWWHKGDPDNAEGSIALVALGGTVFVFWLGYFLSPMTLGMIESMKNARNQAEFQKSVRQLDEDSQQQSRQMGRSQSMQEIVTRLGTIDQFIRVYRSETERSRKVITLQAAHAEVTNLNGKVLSNEIDGDSLTHPEVMACVRETIADLQAAGLSEDRLYRDLRRVFRLQ
jgi:hypothetical protein